MLKKFWVTFAIFSILSASAYATQPWVVNLVNYGGRILEAGTVVSQNATKDNGFCRAPANARAVLGVLATNCTTNATCPVAVSGTVKVLKFHRANNTLNSTATTGNVCFMGAQIGEANCTLTTLTGAGRNATLGIVVANSTNRTQTARIMLQVKPN